MAPRIAIGEVDASAPILNLPSADEIGARLEAFLEANDSGDLGPQAGTPAAGAERCRAAPSRPVGRLSRI